MKRSIFLAGMLLPVLSYSQSADSTARSRLITTAPKLGGINISNLVAPVRLNGKTFTMQTPVVDIGIPVYKDFTSQHPTLIRIGIRYQGLLLSNEKVIAGNNFHSITIPLIASYSLSKTINISLIGLASIGSDFKKNIKQEDLLYTAGVRVGFRRSKFFKFGVTAAYTKSYAGNFLIPLPDIDWTISKRLSFSGVVPSRISLKYKISEPQFVGITMGLNGTMYRLNEMGKDQYIHLTQNSAGLLYELTFRKRWKLNVIAGHTFNQRLETFNMDQKVSFNGFGKLNDRIPNVSYRQNSFIFQGGISYQF